MIVVGRWNFQSFFEFWTFIIFYWTFIIDFWTLIIFGWTFIIEMSPISLYNMDLRGRKI